MKITLPKWKGLYAFSTVGNIATINNILEISLLKNNDDLIKVWHKDCNDTGSQK